MASYSIDEKNLFYFDKRFFKAHPLAGYKWSFQHSPGVQAYWKLADEAKPHGGGYPLLLCNEDIANGDAARLAELGYGFSNEAAKAYSKRWLKCEAKLLLKKEGSK
jgi:hypothetical protein